VQDYLGAIHRLNAYAEIPSAQLIRTILTGIKPRLRSNMAHYESLRHQPGEWRKKLVEMDVVQAELQITRSNPPNPSAPKRTYSERTESTLNAPKRPYSEQSGSRSNSTSTYVPIPKEVMDKRQKERRCLKCGRSGHMRNECRSTYRLTPPPRTPTQPLPNDKKPRTEHVGTVRITEIGSNTEPEDNGGSESDYSGND